MKKEKKYLLYGIGLVLLTLIGVTFAYFSTQIVGNRKNVTINTADLRIIFTNGDSITGNNIGPGWSITKTFSVENKTKSDYKYNIVIKDLLNNFVTEGYLQYKITSSNGFNMSDFEDVPKRSSANDTTLAYNINISSRSLQEYTIVVQYKNDEGKDQSVDMAKTLSGKLFIAEGTEEPTLKEAMLRDNPTISERTGNDFYGVIDEDTTGTIFQTNKTEDGNTVYYYAGKTTNNWVKFGKYNTNDTSDLNLWQIGNDMYWKIIRTNEDGSIRILYSGTSPDTTSGYVGISKYNENFNDPMFVGYMYGTTGSLENNRTNTNHSTIKTAIDTWYKNSLLTNYDKYISKSTIYCNDRSTENNSYSTSGTFYYSGNKRLFSSKVPSYKCGSNVSDGLFETTQAIADKFSANTSGGGNGQLTYPVALMTADELLFAGEFPYAGYCVGWACNNSNGLPNFGKSNYSSWLLTPKEYYNGISFMFAQIGERRMNDLGGKAPVTYEATIRPVISLSSCVKVKSGNGTPESPYEVDYTGSCN